MSLSNEIQKEYDRLMKLVASIPTSQRNKKLIDGTGGMVSISDLIAYQIGWGKCVIRWYEEGIQGQMPDMPGEGFSKWDYTAIAKHFYKKYNQDQERVFYQVIQQLLAIIEKESKSGNLDKTGVWPWCTLSSGKEWPLSKWIKVNTVSPYKRAYTLIRKFQNGLVASR